MKSWYFHGTTLDHAKNILAGKGKETYNWACSDDDYLYVWGCNCLQKSEEFENKEKYKRTIERAFESAEIAGCLGKKDTKLIVIGFLFDDQDLEPDFSCDNMKGAFCIPFLDAKPIKIRLFEKHLSAFKIPVLLSTLIGMDLFNDSNFSDEELAIAKAIREAGIYIESDYDFKPTKL